ncbi:zf-HC2 domain-containing protein [Paenibacillus mesophilus]|uniref:anti-sigma factor family protein n=1 Tax=Paenibacillus mesophilus TaxID=2582849 RepID=UPI00110D8344|nr:zf-HC2 domain-containing protein [Paenibacillus mesophilus]TMV51258.1 zf-HC2 domain-containing protein [Paenibacillus mesophilus]
MKCQDVQEWLGAYWDLPEHDDRRQAVDEHIRHCASCREEFEIWEESTELIRNTVGSVDHRIEYVPVSSQVMNRIYADESWRIPVPQRLYAFSYKMRRNFTAVVALCMTLFVFGFVLSIMGVGAEDKSPRYGLKPVASVTTDVQTVSGKAKALPVATASLKDPYMVKMGPFRSVPDYMVVMSLLGLTGTILIMNWLSRTKI